MMVNLKERPYNLDEESIRWVEETIDNMTIEEKIGQLFVNMGSSRDESYLKDVLDNYHIVIIQLRLKKYMNKIEYYKKIQKFHY